MTYIKSCYDKYLKEFPQDWIDTLDFSSPDKAKESLRLGFDKINSFSEKAFDCFSKSVLTGEYVMKSNNISKTLSDFEMLVMHESIYESSDNSYKMILNQYELLDHCLSSCIKSYRSLYSLVENKVDTLSHDMIFNAYRDNYSERISITLLKIFVQIVVPLCKKDHMLSFAKNNLSELIIIKHNIEEIQKNNSHVVFPILLDKVSFLLKKMLHVNGVVSEYSLDFKIYNIEKKDIQLTNLKSFDDRFEFIHDINGIPNLISEVPKWKDSIRTSKAKISDIILLMRYYQSLKSSLKDIDALINYYDELYNRIYVKVQRKSLFNRHSLETIRNYLYNCRLSYKLKSGLYDNIESFYTDMDIIEHLQSETNIFNFYPYKKALSFLNERIEESISKLPKDTDECKLEDLIKKFSYYLSKYENCLKWCENIYFYPFQLMYKDSTVLYDGGIRVFYPSTFTRPMRYDELQKNLKNFQTDYLYYKNRLDLVKERFKIEGIKSEMKQIEVKNIKILGLFTSVVTFLFGTINVFTTTKTLKETLTSSLGLGIILLLFCSILYFLLLPEKKSFVQNLTDIKFIFFGLFTIIYLVLLFKTVLV